MSFVNVGSYGAGSLGTSPFMRNMSPKIAQNMSPRTSFVPSGISPRNSSPGGMYRDPSGRRGRPVPKKNINDLIGNPVAFTPTKNDADFDIEQEDNRKHSAFRFSQDMEDDSQKSIPGNGSIDNEPFYLIDKDNILHGYLVGQIANVVKAGMWWVGFSPLIFALFSNNSFVVGYARVAFNAALCFCSPVAGAVVEKLFIRKILNFSSVGRGLIYGLILPLAWLFLEAPLVWEPTASAHVVFLVVFLLCVSLDGIIVAFAAISDIDSGGTDLVAIQYGLGDHIDDNTRNRFNSLHIMSFDASMIVFSPVFAYLALLFAQKVGNMQFPHGEVNADVVALLSSMAVVFIITSLVQVLFYNKSMPSLRKEEEEEEPAEGGDAEKPSKCQMLKEAIVEGAKLTWRATAIRWRILFLALETALEDAVISIAIVEFAQVIAINAPDHKDAYGALYTAAFVAIGKCGGVFASLIMNRCFKVDPETGTDAAYRPLFWCVFIGGIFSLGIPLSYHLHQNVLDEDQQWVASVVMGVSCFLFFLFSTLAKIGFATLLQSLAAKTGVSGRVFGFIGTAVTTTDAILLMLLSAAFASFSHEVAFWIMGGVVAFHGLVELVFGPWLMLAPLDPNLEKPLLGDPGP